MRVKPIASRRHRIAYFWTLLSFLKTRVIKKQLVEREILGIKPTWRGRDGTSTIPGNV